MYKIGTFVIYIHRSTSKRLLSKSFLKTSPILEKFIVYFGIAWWAVDGIPTMLEYIQL